MYVQLQSLRDKCHKGFGIKLTLSKANMEILSWASICLLALFWVFTSVWGGVPCESQTPSCQDSQPGLPSCRQDRKQRSRVKTTWGKSFPFHWKRFPSSGLYWGYMVDNGKENGNYYNGLYGWLSKLWFPFLDPYYNTGRNCLPEFALGSNPAGLRTSH